MKTLFFNSVFDITDKVLKNLDIKCILLDMDNTVRPFGNVNPHNGADEWIRGVEKIGVKVILCSNNFKKNVAPLAKKLNCDYVSFCLKPSPIGFIRGKIKSHTNHKQILVVGDQLFTDILGGKLLLLKTALVEPIDLKAEAKTLKIRRFLLKGLADKIKKRGNPFL